VTEEGNFIVGSAVGTLALYVTRLEFAILEEGDDPTQFSDLFGSSVRRNE
jgi:hypothetical protein